MPATCLALSPQPVTRSVPASQPAQRMAKPSSPSTSNIVAVPRPRTQELSGTSRRLEYERQARAQLEADNAWWQADTGVQNIHHAPSPREFKRLVLSAAADQLVLVDYFRPSCHACRSIAPKLKQLAEQNQDLMVIKVNTEEDGMLALAEAMGVQVLPWFQLWKQGEPVTGFTANISTLSRLRAEVAAHKSCTDPMCATH